MTDRKKKKKTKENLLHRYSLSLTIGAIAVIVAALGLGLFAMQGFRGNKAEWIRFDSERLTQKDISDTLCTRLGHQMGKKVYLLWRLQGGSPEHIVGAYRVDPGQSAASISRRLAKNRQTPVTVTFTNLRTMKDLAKRLDGQLRLSSEEFMCACDSILSPLGFTRAQYPAAFIPDTYEFYYTIEPSRLVKKLLDERNKFWNVERTAKADAMGLTPIGVATLASIVEEETNKTEERPKVARLYLNRLNKNMKLQADPTVKFAIGDFSVKRIGGDMLRTPSPYNTYIKPGLPPGPIRIAERATMEGVLNAPAHNYLYMCAKEDFSGYHNFATDYNTHRDNARRYQAELNRRNIK